jgi:hypothetical protein
LKGLACTTSFEQDATGVSTEGSVNVPLSNRVNRSISFSLDHPSYDTELELKAAVGDIASLMRDIMFERVQM